jgi:FixJ family two-component response regulator
MSGRVLVVDDEPHVRLSYRVALETEGYDVVEVNSGKAALDQLVDRRFGLAILDMRMPEMDGLELLARMRENKIGVPVVIVTAYSDVPHAVKAMKLGAIDFLQKPLKPEELRTLVADVFKRHAPESFGGVRGIQESFAAHITAARRALNLQAFAKARVHLVKAMELNPQSVEAFNLAGVLAELQEDFDKARKYYGQAIKLDKHYEPAQQNMRRLFELHHLGATDEPISLGEE